MTDGALLPPGLLMVAAGLLLPLLPAAQRPLAAVGGPLAALAYTLFLTSGGLGAGGAYAVGTVDYLGMTLTPVRLDPLAFLFALVFTIAGMGAGLFAARQSNRVELSAALVYSGSAVGAVMAGDLLTLFIFWELMAVASTVVIWSGAPGAERAGLRYAVIHFIGGVLLMIGVAGHIAETGSIAFTAMEATGPASVAILLSFLLNAGAWPVSAWLPDAYPRASWSGMVYLSAFTTKTAVYALIRGFPGEEWLIWAGLWMIVYGFLYAMWENDIRKLLAYAIVNQVGFMVLAVGIGTAKALDGATAQAFVHILYKALLIMVAGSVFLKAGTTKATGLGGLARSMPVTFFCCLAAAATAMALPMTAGYASKSLISSAAGKEHLALAWFAVIAGAAGVVFNAGLRLPWLVFLRRHEGAPDPATVSDPPASMRAAMIVLAVLCIVLGPGYLALYALLPNGTVYAPYDLLHTAETLLLMGGAAAVFVALRQRLLPRTGIVLDVDFLWRGVGRMLASAAGSGFIRSRERAAERSFASAQRFIAGLYRMHGPGSELAKTRPSGFMALWMTLLLGVFMLASFI